MTLNEHQITALKFAKKTGIVTRAKAMNDCRELGLVNDQGLTEAGTKALALVESGLSPRNPYEVTKIYEIEVA